MSRDAAHLAMVGGAGSVDRVAVVVLAIGVYLALPGSYSSDAPRKSWSFTIPLPRNKVEAYLVRDFQGTVASWSKVGDQVSTVRKVKQGHLVETGQYDMVVNWKKTAAHTFVQSNKCSAPFLKRELRPGPAELMADPGIDWAVEWTLVAQSENATEVRIRAPVNNAPGFVGNAFFLGGGGGG